MQELEDVLPIAGGGPRHSLRIAGDGSGDARPAAQSDPAPDLPLDRLDFDLHEGAPGEVLEALYARRANIGLVAAGSLPEAALGFRQAAIASDPYVLVVPEACWTLAIAPRLRAARTAAGAFEHHAAIRVRQPSQPPRPGLV